MPTSALVPMVRYGMVWYGIQFGFNLVQFVGIFLMSIKRTRVFGKSFAATDSFDIQFQPGLVICPGKGKAVPYVRFGLLLVFPIWHRHLQVIVQNN